MFVEPDWSQAIDFSERLSAVPKTATVRGMFLHFVLASAPVDVAAKYASRRYLAFKSYPMRDYVQILAHACEAWRPELAPAECVRRMGWGVYPKYADTITGTAIFAIAGKDFARVIELAPTAYRIALAPASVNVVTLTAGHARVELRECWNVPEFHQVGIWEGAMRMCSVEGEIKIARAELSAVDFDIHWRP